MSLFNKFGHNINEGVETAKKTPGSIIVDVRTPDEYKEGHVPGSINLPLNQINDADFDEDAQLFVYCLSGARADRANDLLTAQGYKSENIGGINKYKGELEK